MKHSAVVLLVCLLIAGTVSALAPEPGMEGAARVIANTSLVPVNPLAPQAGAGITPDIFLVVNLDSVPAGATVRVDGAADPAGTTPVKLGLRPGTHTLLLSHPGYLENTTTVTLTAGMPSRFVTVELRRIALVQGRETAAAVQQFPVIPPVSLVPGGRSTVEPAGASGTVLLPGNVVGPRTIVPVTPVPQACPNSDWQCLTDHEAQLQIGYPFARYGNAPCGYALENNQTTAQYCYRDVDDGGSLSAAALAAPGIRDGDDIFIENATWIQHAVVNRTAAQKGPAAATPWQAFFDFFSGILGGSSRPDSRLIVVGFDPCPEPPGR